MLALVLITALLPQLATGGPSAQSADVEVTPPGPGKCTAPLTAKSLPRVLGAGPTASSDSLATAIGAAKRLSGGHHDSYSMCYLSDRPGDTTVLSFGSGIMGGTYSLSTKQPRDMKSSQCLKVGTVHQGLALSNGIRLGMNQEDVRKRLGTPLKMTEYAFEYSCTEIVRLSASERREWLARASAAHAVLPENPYWLRDASIFMSFEGESLAEIQVSETSEASWLPWQHAQGDR